METTTSKQELIDWISTIEDKETLLILQGIKHQSTFNFDEEFKKEFLWKYFVNKYYKE